MSGGRVGAIILAAGGSSRLGSSKQLLPFRGRSLVRHVAELSLGTTFDPVVVVLGAEAERVRRELSGLRIQTAMNSRWPEGMASSIQTGLRALSEDVDAIVIQLCDQPLIELDFFRSLLAAHASGCALAAAEYDGTVGVPALFGRDYFPELEALRGKSGAKAILLRHLETVKRIPCPQAAMDLDTVEDLAVIRSNAAARS